MNTEFLSGKRIAVSDLMSSRAVQFGTSGARGRVVDLTDELCYACTAAFLQGIEGGVGGKVALAIDLRPSSPEIASACAAAIRAAGLEVDYCGAIPTPALAWYALQRRQPAIMVTGSHIPFDRNGMKFYRSSGEISKADEARITAATVILPDRPLSVPLPSLSPAAWQFYLYRYLDFFPPRILAGMKLGLYEHSGVARDLLRRLLEQLGAEVISLGRTEDFVPLDTEAVSAAEAEEARRWAVQHRFDAILSTDGDADRPLVGDETGQWFRGDITGILCARYLQARAVVTTVSCNTAVDSCGSFARVKHTRIGSPYVIEGIEQLLAEGETGVVGFEPNGGFLVGSPFEKHGRQLAPLPTRDAVLPMLSLLAMAKSSGVRMSELPKQLPSRYTASDRLQNIPTTSSQPLIAALAALPASLEILLEGLCGKALALDRTDGLRITLEGDEILHFRPSGNAPELRCYAEADTPLRAGELVAEGLRRLQVAMNEAATSRVP